MSIVSWKSSMAIRRGLADVNAGRVVSRGDAMDEIDPAIEAAQARRRDAGCPVVT
jgi:predicted transcriptional regulator